jgi:Zn-dependent protease with chaperone function
MTSAKRLYRFVLLVAALGVAVVTAAAIIALGNVTLSPQSSHAFFSACRRLIVPELSVEGLATLVMALVGIIAVVSGGRSLVRQLRAQGRYRAALRIRGTRRINGLDVAVVDDDDPQAFCAGLLRPTIFVSTGAIECLTASEMRAVIAHERHHLVRRDPARILLARTLADTLFFLPVVKRLSRRYEQLAEVAADDASLTSATGRGPLASALLAFGERGTESIVVGITPERVDHLLGAAPRWQLPRALLAVSLAAAAALVAIAMALSMAGSPDRLNLSMLLASSCMLLMVGVPLALLLAARFVARPRASTRA